MQINAPANKLCQPAASLVLEKSSLSKSLSKDWADLSDFEWREAKADDLVCVPSGFEEVADVLLAVGGGQEGKTALLGERQWFGWPDEGRFALVVLQSTVSHGVAEVVSGSDYSMLDEQLFGVFFDVHRTDGEPIEAGVSLARA